MAAAFSHTEPSGLIFWCCAQHWPIKASSELCPAVPHHHVVSWAECAAVVDNNNIIPQYNQQHIVHYRSVMLSFVLKFKIQRNLSIWEILTCCITGCKNPTQ